jgi:hypothetical protein
MRRHFLLAALAATACTVAVAGPFDGFKGKMKEGMYEYNMDMYMASIPGMPPGMGKQSHTFNHCVTAKDIDEGAFGKGKDQKKSQNCEIKNMQQSGNSASYTMECKGDPKMKSDVKMTFVSDGFDMEQKMQMDRGGQVMNMNQKMTGRYKGPCK